MLKVVKTNKIQQDNDENEEIIENEDIDEEKNINKKNKIQATITKGDLDDNEGSEEGEGFGDEQKTAKIYQKIQDQIIKDAIEVDTKKQVFVQKQIELTDQIVYKSFDKTHIKLNSDYLFSKKNCENVDLRYLEQCVKSINLTRLSPSQLSELQQNEIFSKLQNVEEIFCWYNDDYDEDNLEKYRRKQYNSSFENIINHLSTQLKLLDLRRSSISLANIFDTQNPKQFMQLKILKVTRSFFFNFYQIQDFLDRISTTIEYIEILNTTGVQKNQNNQDNQAIDFSKLINLQTFILHDSVSLQIQKPLPNLPKQIQNLKLFSLKQNIDFLQINEFKQLTNLTITNNLILSKREQPFFYQKNNTIKFLCLKNNSLNIKQLENLKINNLESLETLIVNHNPLYKDDLDNDASFLNSEESFDSLKQLEVFDGENDQASDQQDEDGIAESEDEEGITENEDEEFEEEKEASSEEVQEDDEEEEDEVEEESSGEDSQQNSSKKKQQKGQNKKIKDKKLQISKLSILKKNEIKFCQIIDSFKNSLINLCMRNCNINEEIFDQVDFTSFKQLQKLDISRNKNFFLKNKQVFKNALNQIAWNLQELNVGQTNICLETNLSQFDFKKLQKLSIFKSKLALKIFKASQKTETFQSKEALQFMNAIIPQLTNIQLTEIVIGADWHKLNKLRVLDINNMNLEKFKEVQRRDQVIELQKLIKNAGKGLEVLNMNKLVIQAQELELINWQNLINLKLLNISNIDCFEQNFNVIGKITEKMMKIEQIILKHDGIEKQILTLPWKNFPNLRNIYLEKEQEISIYLNSLQNNVFKSYLKNDQSFAMMPLQLFNTRILNPSHNYYQHYQKMLNQKEGFSKKNPLNQAKFENNQHQTLILDRIKYNFSAIKLQEIDQIYEQQISYSTYAIIMWNLIRIDILLNSDLNQLQKILSQQAFNQKILYFNNINCYLFFIFSQINDESFQDLILNSNLLESNHIETVFIQQLNHDKFFIKEVKTLLLSINQLIYFCTSQLKGSLSATHLTQIEIRL
ncbi:hypothetical protein ABPG74_004960 [Tetrahymena malaccensis]